MLTKLDMHPETFGTMTHPNGRTITIFQKYENWFRGRLSPKKCSSSQARLICEKFWFEPGQPKKLLSQKELSCKNFSFKNF